MKNEKECNIIRDLLPNYIEKLTNNDTNEFIEKHIENCKKCNDLLKNYENTLQTLSGQKIVNFGTQTNTDLKITYGTASLPALTEYEQNFTTLCQTLTAYAGQLFELGHTDDARTILEYGISIGSDLSQNYLLLAKIYQSSGETGRIRELLASAEQLDSLMKRSIVEKLTAMLPEDTTNTPVQWSVSCFIDIRLVPHIIFYGIFP